MDLLISTGVFGLVLTLTLVITTGRRRGGANAYTLLQKVTKTQAEPEDDVLRHDPRREYLQRQEVLGSLYHFKLLKLLEDNMCQAGLYLRMSEMLLILVMMFGIGAALGTIVLEGGVLLAAASGAAMAALPIAYTRILRHRRLKAFSQQLPFALDLVKSSLEAGHSLLRGLQVLVDEFSDPLGSEFRTVIEQARLGMPLPQAFDDLLRRVPQDDLRLLVVAIKVQSEVGSSLAEIVSRLAEIVRTRQRLESQIRAMTAQARMSGLIVALLPIIVLTIFSMVQPNYTNVLFHTPFGIKVVKATIVLDTLGFLTIRKIVKIDY